MDSKKLVESKSSKNMFSVVQEMDAGYNKFFDSKPNTSAIRSECYKNYKTCGSSSGDVPKGSAEIENDKNNSVSEMHSPQSLIQEVILSEKNYLSDNSKKIIFSVFPTTKIR